MSTAAWANNEEDEMAPATPLSAGGGRFMAAASPLLYCRGKNALNNKNTTTTTTSVAILA